MDEEGRIPDEQVCRGRDDIHAQRAVTSVSEGCILERDGRPSNRGASRAGLERDDGNGRGGGEAGGRSGLCRGGEVDGGGGHETAYSEHGHAHKGEEHALVWRGRRSAGSGPEGGARLACETDALPHKATADARDHPMAFLQSHVDESGESWVGLLKRRSCDPVSPGLLVNSDMESLGGLLLLLRGSTNSALHCI